MKFLSIVTALLALTAAPASATARTQSYVALGDSYAAGIGAGDYTGSACVQSRTGAYPYLWAKAHPTAKLTFRACSGATTATVLATQLGSLSKSTRWVTVTAGGNDAGFATTLQTCLLGSDADCSAAVQQSTKIIRSALPTAADTLYTAIRKKAPNARVYVVGYPHLLSTGGGTGCVFDPTRRQLLNSTSDTLATVLRQHTAHRKNFTFVDGRTILAGHEVCTAHPWIHGLATGDLTESFHPTAAGHQAYAKALTKVMS
ncbi:secreted hydrolase [Actinoplanes sp. SE50]|uniref:SGNH/GDSL hydrolase family protein n=1 Tax=unclassified Actinoplanes TaxID=2626549 RepID=UPI00023EC9F1|nr:MULTISPECIES: SGNH/GDSL hydrolase family protein [unclassified Actinoplanes]AEV86509.1 secreted hydrolase [Actinoplanes sp. SE50/110]ATO84907.1 secreted hydrolase [Actinoplanes sp. SE50]SLM02316.1 secreted hydrolase [Actinoplanes sp. SE50/110]